MKQYKWRYTGLHYPKLSFIFIVGCITSVVVTFLMMKMIVQENKPDLIVYEQKQQTEKLRKEQHWQTHKAYVNYRSHATALNKEANANHTPSAYHVHVWQEQKQDVLKVPLEDYVLQVALSEMPWGFHDEAIKAQLIAARTYIMYRMDEDENSVQVSDSTKHQVYRPIAITSLSASEQTRYNAIATLAKQTEGMIITYEGELIDALYFSTSNGKTESSQHYFNFAVPYLQSVESKWDAALSTSYTHTSSFTYEQFYASLIEAGMINKREKGLTLQILERTSSNRVARLLVNEIELTGRQLRDALGLASTDFSWKLDSKNKQITLYTIGYGHGVGMSQWGAEGMAQSGYKAEDILRHYYMNVEVESL